MIQIRYIFTTLLLRIYISIIINHHFYWKTNCRITANSVNRFPASSTEMQMGTNISETAVEMATNDATKKPLYEAFAWLILFHNVGTNNYKYSFIRFLVKKKKIPSFKFKSKTSKYSAEEFKMKTAFINFEFCQNSKNPRIIDNTQKFSTNYRRIKNQLISN